MVCCLYNLYNGSGIDFSLPRTFTGPESWVISLPTLATVLLLMTNPAKKVEADTECPDRDLSWCLDSLHGFCRSKGPEEGDRPLSWSLGTFPDCWMYLHFIFYHFMPGIVIDGGKNSEKWKGSGIQCDRRAISLPIGWNGETESFIEERLCLSVRTTTPYKGEKVDTNCPSTVGFAMRESYHFEFRAARSDWTKSGLESPRGASGVTLFQLLLLRGIDEWSENWNSCLTYIDRLHQIKVRVQTIFLLDLIIVAAAKTSSG